MTISISNPSRQTIQEAAKLSSRSPQVLTTITAEALFIAYKYLQHECLGVPQCFTKFLQSVRPPTFNNNGLWDPLAIIARRRK